MRWLLTSRALVCNESYTSKFVLKLRNRTGRRSRYSSVSWLLLPRKRISADSLRCCCFIVAGDNSRPFPFARKSPLLMLYRLRGSNFFSPSMMPTTPFGISLSDFLRVSLITTETPRLLSTSSAQVTTEPFPLAFIDDVPLSSSNVVDVVVAIVVDDGWPCCCCCWSCCCFCWPSSLLSLGTLIRFNGPTLKCSSIELMFRDIILTLCRSHTFMTTTT